MGGGVFISYRREDTAGYARLIYDRLSKRLGRAKVFMDVENIQPGLDFREVLSESLGKCDALIAVIGKDWISNVDKQNQRRIDDPHDFVRIEIEAALDRGVRVIPVFVEGAVMPKLDELPDRLKKLSGRQGIDISHAQFDSDVKKLTRFLSSMLSLIEEELRQREEAERAVAEAARRPDVVRRAQKASGRPEAPQAVKTVNLALQGGGSHAAYTWGALDALAEDSRIEISAISGSSGGTMNAVVFASGISEGGREGARAKLEKFWLSVSEYSLLPFQLQWVDKALAAWAGFWPGGVALDRRVDPGGEPLL